MSKSPQGGAFGDQTGLRRKDVATEPLQVLAVSEELSPILGLHQLAVEMDRVLDCLVFDRQDLHSQDNLLKEELSSDIVTGSR